MATSAKPQVTDFTRDVFGRYICNGLDEARRSADPTAMRPDGRAQVEARDFDRIVIGGGTFGAVIAEHMSFRDRARHHRVLVLEAGPVLLGEHVQNIPALGLDAAAPTSIQQLRADGQFGPDQPQREVWGLPWHSSQKFPGLAYCLGGRSLYWGGWSPELLPGELSVTAWPAQVVNDLTAKALPDGSPGYLQQASDQIGVTQTNDFIFGDLHRAARSQLFAAVEANQVAAAVALASLPDHPAIRYGTAPPDLPALLGLLPGTPAPPDPAAKNELKLEAPLAVQGQPGHAGFFPFNKFSTVPLLAQAARDAYAESLGDDARKRVMVVPRCHVIRLITVADGNQRRVVQIATNQGTIDVPQHASVIIALGTIESTRLALLSFKDIPAAAYARIGTNLMAHVRSNLDLRFLRSNVAGLSPAVKALQASALFVKGRVTLGGGPDVGHFHLQITASGLGAVGGNSESELFKKIPDIDLFNIHRNANDTHVVMTIRGIGEMQSQNASNRLTLDPEVDEFGAERCLVSLADPLNAATRATNPQADRDFQVWQAMDKAAKDVAKVFGVANPSEPKPDGLGTTHHETGTLYMGESGSSSVTLPDCRVRHVTNAYVVGPALFPTIGSPNPMLTGVALARRLGDQLAISAPYQGEAGFDVLFDGADTGKWRMTTIRDQPPERSDSGAMRVIEGALETVAGNDMGIYWCTVATPPNFVLRLQWLRWTQNANSGVYVRFPGPETKGYRNTAYVADDFGFEAQIDELGAPDGLPIHKTGAIYRKDNRADNENLTQKPARAIGEWNDYEIRVEGQKYTVTLNGDRVCVFDNTDVYPGRGVSSTVATPTFIGLQVYPNSRYYVRFRNVRIRALA
jgi:choline dehydrogenase-like flavoprotein